MAVPAWATDLTTIDLDPAAVTSYAALGGGPAGLTAETDFYIQGGATPSCASKSAWNTAVRGLMNDTDGIPWTVPTDGILLCWAYYSAPASLDTKAGGGFRIVAGSSATAYYEYYCGGKDTLTFESWVPYVVDPNNATADSTVGTPSGTWNGLGAVADLPGAGPTKGAPIGIDGLRYGRHTLEYTAGEAADYNDFAKAEASANSLANRWGNIEFNKGAYYIQGFHSLGTAAALVDFRDSDKVIFIRAAGANCLTNDAVSIGYTRIEILNASSNVDWTNILITALGTRARGVFVHTAGSFDAVKCQFTGLDTFSLLAASSMTECIFTGCNEITAPGSDLTGSSFLTPTVLADSYAILWNVSTDPDGLLDDTTFEMGANAHHALEFGLAGAETITLNNVEFTGFDGDAVNGSAINILRTTGTTTITGTGPTEPTIKTAGATVVVNWNTVTVRVTARPAADPTNDIQGARVLLGAGSGGALPYQVSVSIARTGAVATVTHATHGLASGDEVSIEGATNNEYNGVHSITVTGVSTYTYAVTGTPATPDTTATSTYVFLNALTDVNGVVEITDFSYTADQPVEGRVRKGTATPRYKTAPLVGSIVSTGYDVDSFMVSDE